jgi:hypothetical protein
MKVFSTLLIVAIVMSLGLVLNTIFSLIVSILISGAVVYFTWRKQPVGK